MRACGTRENSRHCERRQPPAAGYRQCASSFSPPVGSGRRAVTSSPWSSAALPSERARSVNTHKHGASASGPLCAHFRLARSPGGRPSRFAYRRRRAAVALTASGNYLHISASYPVKNREKSRATRHAQHSLRTRLPSLTHTAMMAAAYTPTWRHLGTRGGRIPADRRRFSRRYRAERAPRRAADHFRAAPRDDRRFSKGMRADFVRPSFPIYGFARARNDRDRKT